MTIKILIGDVRAQLRTLAADSVHCCVTSPPYWGLRDYGVEGQIGLEETPAEFIAVMVDVFEEVRRVLRPDGTCWINMGDSYSHGGGGSKNDARWPKEAEHGNTTPKHLKAGSGLKPKDLCMMPHRLAIALQDAGWWVRQDIVWSKSNPMPESVRDRCTKSHEYIFLLAKSANYFYDAEAVKEPAVGFVDHPRNSFGNKDYEVPGQKPQKRTARGVGFGHGTDADERKRGRVLKGNAKSFRGGGVYTAGAAFDNDADVDRSTHGNSPNETGLRNRRSVWTMATHSFAEAHFATFPPELPEICIRAGCPPGGTVLDPFFGAGTTGLVADRLQRECIGIELNPAYAALARKRIQSESPLFSEIS